MNEEKLNNAPTAPEPDVSAEPTEEPVVEQVNAEEQIDEPVAEEPVERPVEEPAAEEHAEDQPAEEQPVTEPLEESTPEPSTEELETKPVEEEPTVPAEAPEEPAEPTNPDLVASAEAETPAEQAPTFPNDASQTQKSKKPLIIAVIAFLILALGGTGIWYFLLRDKGTTPDTSVQNDVEPAPDLEPIPANKLALRDNNLSDFDLAFLRLENKQDNIIYSPLSIKYALAMLADGANGRSKEQIASVIGDYQPKAYLNSANRSLANGMFIRTEFSENVKSTYTDTLKNKYYAEVIYDPFDSPDNANKWVEDKTLGIIKNTFNEATVNHNLDYMLVNALAIDMKWNNAIQCDYNATIPYKKYSVYYPHEDYSDYTSCSWFSEMTFNEQENIKSGKVAASANRYDIIEELGESYIRETVQAKYDEWLEDVQNRYKDCQQDCYDASFDLDEYVKQLDSNYNRLDTSTDFYFLDTDEEKIFAKDLQEYDGSVFQYVGVMPKTSSLNTYLNNLTAEKATTLISSLKNPDQLETFKEGVVTKLNGNIPFFKFNFTMDMFANHLQSLGITDVFSTEDANLSNMLIFDETASNKPYIATAIHKADIDFSNEGIKAGAVTAFGGTGAGGMERFDYRWDIPVEEIDLTFDKPFLFLIRDKSTGEVWFVGTVYEGKTE